MLNLTNYFILLKKWLCLYSKKVKNKLFPSLNKREIMRWYKDGGDFEMRFNYSLNENSIVFDLGGYKGNFASDLFSRMPCNIYIFEPVKQNYLIIKERFKLNNKIEAFPFGLSNIT